MELTRFCFLIRDFLGTRVSLLGVFLAKRKTPRDAQLKLRLEKGSYCCNNSLEWKKICVKIFHFNSRADLSSSTSNAHYSALFFSKTLFRGSALLVVQVLT